MAKLVINAANKKSKIEKEIYGHFSEHLGRCIYEGFYVGEDSPIPNKNGMRTDVVEAMKKIQIPVLRWPGGCFADEYHWMDGVGPKETRKKMINTHWGGVLEDNSFGTNEFFELVEQLGCEAYVNGNLGSGSVREMSEWVEYITFDGVSPMADLRAKNGHKEPWKVKFWGVGNENWGCGGNMTPEYYANEYRRYQTYIRNYNQGEHINKICCGPSNDDYAWTETVMKTCFDHCEKRFHGNMDLLSLHYYTVPGPWEAKGSATDFTEDEYFITLNKALYMDEILDGHSAIMDQYDPDKTIGLSVDEWGTWFDVEPGTNPGFLYQQNTMRDALVAGVSLNIFNKHSDRVKMANIAQTINVLQSVILTDGEDMILTPTYHVFDLYKHHQNNMLLDSYLETEEIGPDGSKVPNLTESVSVDEEGTIHITLTNLSLTDDYDIDVTLVDHAAKEVSAEIVTGAVDAKNTFEETDVVKAEAYDGVSLTETGLKIKAVKCSVLHIAVK